MTRQFLRSFRNTFHRVCTGEMAINRNDIKNVLRELTGDFIDEEIISDEAEQKSLFQIVSESTQAMEYVVLIESEFDMEFDDNDIDVEFFSSLDNITDLIVTRLQTHE